MTFSSSFQANRLSRRIPRSLQLAFESLESRQLLAVTFNPKFVGGNQLLFNDPVQGPDLQAAFIRVANELGQIFDHTATIDIDVLSSPTNGTLFASAQTKLADSNSRATDSRRGISATRCRIKNPHRRRHQRQPTGRQPGNIC